MVDKVGGFSAIELAESALELSADGGSTWQRVPGVASLSYTAGERTSNQIESLDGNRVSLGPVPISDVSVELTSYLPQHATGRSLRTAYTDNSLRKFRFTTKETTLFPRTASGTTAAVVAATGRVTFAGTANVDLSGGSYYPGVVLVIGSNKLAVDKIDVAGSTYTVDVRKPAADISADRYSVVQPSMRLAFDGRVKQYGTFTAASDEGAILSGSLVLTPDAVLPEWTIV